MTTEFITYEDYCEMRAQILNDHLKGFTGRHECEARLAMCSLWYRIGSNNGFKRP